MTAPIALLTPDVPVCVSLSFISFLNQNNRFAWQNWLCSTCLMCGECLRATFDAALRSSEQPPPVRGCASGLRFVPVLTSDSAGGVHALQDLREVRGEEARTRKVCTPCANTCRPHEHVRARSRPGCQDRLEEEVARFTSPPLA